MKKTNNKGFSLVELIVVIAIMAVLMVVVGPQLLRNVEKARIQRDNTALSEIANAAKIAMADEIINASLNAGGTGSTKPYTSNASGVFDFTTDTDPITKELKNVFGDSVKLQSSKYKAAPPTITVAKDSNGIVTVTGTNILDQDGTKYGDDTSGGTLVY